MRFIQPVVDRQTARQRFERQRLKRTRRWIGFLLGCLLRRTRTSKPASGDTEPRRPLPHMEVVWLPCYWMKIEATQKGTSGPVDVLIGGCDGQFTLADLSGVAFESPPDAEPFPPVLDDARADQIARTGLVTAILRSPGWRAKPTLGQTLQVELLQYPFWVYTFERRRRRLDIKVLDAVTGSLPGPKTKASILRAFVDARRSAVP